MTEPYSMSWKNHRQRIIEGGVCVNETACAKCGQCWPCDVAQAFDAGYERGLAQSDTLGLASSPCLAGGGGSPVSSDLVFTHESHEDQAVVFSNGAERVMLGLPSSTFEALGRPEHVIVTVTVKPVPARERE
jgi:hypothetical protein